MSSRKYLESRFYAAEKAVGKVVDDTPVVYRIMDVAGGSSTPTVVMSDTSSTLTLTDSDGDATVIDFSAAAYDTVGEVADYINLQESWECKILDALRSDDSDDTVLNGAVSSASINGETVFDVLQDTSAAIFLTYRCTYDRSVSVNKPKGSHRVNLEQFVYYANLDTATVDTIKIYVWNPKYVTETQIWQATSADASETTHAFTNYPLTGGDGNDLIIRVTDSTSLTDDSSNKLECEYTKE